MSERDRDQALLERLAARDEEALAELHRRYADLLHSLAVRIVGAGAEAEEVLRDAWVEAWRSASGHDPARGSVVAWLVSIARSRALDRVRSAASRRGAESAVAGEAAAVPPPPAPDPAAGYARRMLRKSVAAAVTALAPPQRQVLELAFLDGLSQAEIATRLRAPLGTVKSWTRQALLKLRERVPLEELP
jgi:RNA polymerase sigma-70 factor (ECF subfamily)